MDIKKDLKNMENEVKEIAYEEKSLAMELLEMQKKQNKRLFILLVILIIALVGSNMVWLYVFNSYDYTSEETIVDGEDGTATYLEDSSSGDINYGENSKSEKN